MKNSIIFLICLLLSTGLFSQEAEEIDPLLVVNDTIIWFGADFSLFRLCNTKKVGEEEKLTLYLRAWNTNYKKVIPNVKLASWLSAKKVINDKEFTDNAYKEYLPKTWILGNPYTIDEEVIQEHIGNYTSENKGIGLTYILESFYKGDKDQVNGYFVWFDIESREIIEIYKSKGKPASYHVSSWGVELTIENASRTKGMTGYWLQGMIDATLEFGIDFKKRIPVKEKEY